MDYELIICIVNTGFTDVVMDAARDKGARGGTVLHGRGTANKEAEKFFNISVQPDKELVMILVTSDIKDAVLHAVYQEAGLKTAGQGIAFALPVTNVVGLSSAPPVPPAETVPDAAPTEKSSETDTQTDE